MRLKLCLRVLFCGCFTSALCTVYTVTRFPVIICLYSISLMCLCIETFALICHEFPNVMLYFSLLFTMKKKFKSACHGYI